MRNWNKWVLGVVMGTIGLHADEVKEQKTIGLIGGLSWESTQLYYKQINEMVREQMGGLHSAKILLYSLDYAPILALEETNDWATIAQELVLAAQKLQKGGADSVLLCCNTLHKVAPMIEQAIEIPFIHIADAAGAVLVRENVHKVGLLGTQITMEDGFYSDRLESKFGLSVVVPLLKEREQLNGMIYNELCQGKLLPESKTVLIQMIHALKDQGAEAVLLGCTELGMLVKQHEVDVPIYDTTKLHVQEAVNMKLRSSI